MGTWRAWHCPDAGNYVAPARIGQKPAQLNDVERDSRAAGAVSVVENPRQKRSEDPPYGRYGHGALFRVFFFFRFVFLFPGIGDAVRFRGPLAQIDQLTALGTKGTIAVSGFPNNNFAALRAIHDGFHNSVDPSNGIT